MVPLFERPASKKALDNRPELVEVLLAPSGPSHIAFKLSGRSQVNHILYLASVPCMPKAPGEAVQVESARGPATARFCMAARGPRLNGIVLHSANERWRVQPVRSANGEQTSLSRILGVRLDPPLEPHLHRNS